VAVFFITFILLLYLQKGRVNRALAEKHSALAEAHQRLGILDREKSEFLSLAAHDIYSPLSSVVTSAQRLRSGEIDPPTAAATISSQALRVLNLVRNLLNLEALEAGTIGRHRTPLDLKEAVCKAVERHRQPMRDVGLDLKINLPQSPLTTEADPDALDQILENLLDNARKYSLDGGLVEVSLFSAQGPTALIEVSNPGEPLSPEFCQVIFEKHARGGRAPFDGNSSHGLGLYGVRLLAERMEGTIQVESQPQKPITFRLSLPLVKDRTPTVGSGLPETESGLQTLS
jgi:signal transduction histidine kinase